MYETLRVKGVLGDGGPVLCVTTYTHGPVTESTLKRGCWPPVVMALP
ncbi:MAG: hypothetical protein MUO26_00490 [Methanotrichaceae archaeon]|nr:hypothetical protein [Methanotrichaceae archaeon]